MPSAPHSVRLRLPKTCDRCGGPIAAGEWAQMVFVEENGSAQFYHRVCPGANATVEAPRPRTPGFFRRALGLHGRPALTFA